jgi:hypothetical protein
MEAVISRFALDEVRATLVRRLGVSFSGLIFRCALPGFCGMEAALR